MAEFVIHDSDVPYPAEAEGFDYQWFGYGNPDGILCRGFSEYFMVKEKKVYGLWERIPYDLRDDYDLLHSKVRLEWEVSEQDVRDTNYKCRILVVGYEDRIAPINYEIAYSRDYNNPISVVFYWHPKSPLSNLDNLEFIPGASFSRSNEGSWLSGGVAHIGHYGDEQSSTRKCVAFIREPNTGKYVEYYMDKNSSGDISLQRVEQTIDIEPGGAAYFTRVYNTNRVLKSNLNPDDYIKRIWNNGLRTHIEIGRPNQTKRFTYLRGKTNSPILDVNKNPIWIKRDVV